ncbi:MAG TPA: hypothetical protein VJZ00_19710 [Thermoanaerobaculia bacterium]|nr:hypothetical protein [Thermoanaerobaculia bacterium]
MTRPLEIVFYGLACFDPQPYGYRVLFPDGRNPAPYNVPPHHGWIGIRPQTEVVTARWPGGFALNNFPVPGRGQLEISGLRRTTFDNTQLLHRLSNLQDSDSGFAIDANPDALIDMVVDRGTLSAHQQPTQMILVQWQVEAEDDAAIRINFGSYWIELTPGTTQVILGNTGEAPNDMSGDSDFMLFRKLATQKSGALPVVPPATTPLGALNVIHPIDEFTLTCPFIDCSSVVSHY